MRVVATLKRMMVLRRIAAMERPRVAIGFMPSTFVPMALAFYGLDVPVVGSEHIALGHAGHLPLLLQSVHEIGAASLPATISQAS